MKSEIEEAILAILKKIRTEYPELMKFVNEIPATPASGNSQPTMQKELKAYFDSLQEIYTNYAETHDASHPNTLKKGKNQES